jgi:hypothetical protein
MSLNVKKKSVRKCRSKELEKEILMILAAKWF